MTYSYYYAILGNFNININYNTTINIELYTIKLYNNKKLRGGAGGRGVTDASRTESERGAELQTRAGGWAHAGARAHTGG